MFGISAATTWTVMSRSSKRSSKKTGGPLGKALIKNTKRGARHKNKEGWVIRNTALFA